MYKEEIKQCMSLELSNKFYHLHITKSKNKRNTKKYCEIEIYTIKDSVVAIKAVEVDTLHKVSASMI